MWKNLQRAWLHISLLKNLHCFIPGMELLSWTISWTYILYGWPRKIENSRRQPWCWISSHVRLVGICHCVKNVRIRNFPGPYFPAFGLNKCRREKLQVRILFTQCLVLPLTHFMLLVSFHTFLKTSVNQRRSGIFRNCIKRKRHMAWNGLYMELARNWLSEKSPKSTTINESSNLFSSAGGLAWIWLKWFGFLLNLGNLKF